MCSSDLAKVAIGSNDLQCLKAFLEADAYDGPSIVIAYSHCIAHGINMTKGFQEDKLAVDSGHWPLLRFHPDNIRKGEAPLMLDSKDPKIPLADYIYQETRYKMLTKSNPEEAKKLLAMAEEEVRMRWNLYKQMAGMVWQPKAQ